MKGKNWIKAHLIQILTQINGSAKKLTCTKSSSHVYSRKMKSCFEWLLFICSFLTISGCPESLRTKELKQFSSVCKSYDVRQHKLMIIVQGRKQCEWLQRKMHLVYVLDDGTVNHWESFGVRHLNLLLRLLQTQNIVQIKARKKYTWKNSYQLRHLWHSTVCSHRTSNAAQSSQRQGLH